jgi:N-acetylneuraminic acid mutarotase
MKSMKTKIQTCFGRLAICLARRFAVSPIHRFADSPIRRLAPSLAALCLLPSAFCLASPMGTAFTYQGRLNDGPSPAQGSYDFRFAIYDAAENGAQVGSAIATNAVAVANGLFTATLDFGVSPFSVGQSRWLQIEVRTNGSPSFAALAPRQSLTPAPYSLFGQYSGTAALAERVRGGSITSASLADGAVTGAKLASGAIGSAQLAPGAAAANLAASGQSGVPSGGLILSTRATGSNLLNAGYVKLGALQVGNAWKECAKPVGLYLGRPELTGRQGHTAVWTGSEMIVWGGCWTAAPYGSDQYDDCFNDGGRYNPAVNAWSPVSLTGAPRGRWHHTALWTGSQMIIWGGSYFEGPHTGSRPIYSCPDGARYNPATDSWTSVSTNGAPSARELHTAVWTGTEMLLWGGQFMETANSALTNLNDGGRYHPPTDSWSAIASTAAPGVRNKHTAVWTGSEMIVWGGEYYNAAGSSSTNRNDGGRYHPGSNTWAPVSLIAAPSERCRHSAVWTGTEMLIWGGQQRTMFNGPSPADGGRYHPATDSWTVTGTNGAPTARAHASTIWTGVEMIILGGFYFNQSGLWVACNDGGQYDPIADRWLPLSAAVAPAARTGHSAVWTGDAMLVWGGHNGGNPTTWFNDTFSYTPLHDLYLYQRP